MPLDASARAGSFLATSFPSEALLAKVDLGSAALSVREFLEEAEADPLLPEERDQIIEQASLLIQDFYVHLPLKRSMHAVDPVQRLRLLRVRHRRMNDRRFHDAMLDIFTSLRDLHTAYVLPRPYRGRVAFLPFLLEEYGQEGGLGLRHHVVTRVHRLVEDPHFVRGVEVTHWNGVPIGRAVDVNAAREAGSNEEARQARGLERLTVRPLEFSAAPDEEWVVIDYRDEGGAARQIRFDWKVCDLPGSDDEDEENLGALQAIGIDRQRQIVGRTRKMLFAPKAMEVEQQVGRCRSGVAGAAGPDWSQISQLPEALEFKQVGDGRYGYIRIWTFLVPPDAFTEEIARICRLLPPHGLIIDVRGNGGGYVEAGERILQMLTPGPIEPARFHFINSARTLALCDALESLGGWSESIRQSIETGAVYSQGHPLTSPDRANDTGQIYQGPVVLITDALCYSATDIFAAGFQDHGIGQVLGVHRNTGAGGANVWTQAHLQQWWGKGPFVPLPKSAELRVSIRQSTRVGPRLGVPLEDLGVVPDGPPHTMTRDDVLYSNRDLIAEAMAILAAQPMRSLTATATRRKTAVAVRVRAQGVERVNVFAGGRALANADLHNGAVSMNVRPPAGTTRLELRGFAAEALVAVVRVDVR